MNEDVYTSKFFKYCNLFIREIVVLNEILGWDNKSILQLTQPDIMDEQCCYEYLCYSRFG